jgi:hypothetical protein
VINDHIILQPHLDYLKKTFYNILNLKKNNKPSPPLQNQLANKALKNNV